MYHNFSPAISFSKQIIDYDKKIMLKLLKGLLSGKILGTKPGWVVVRAKVSVMRMTLSAFLWCVMTAMI